MSEESRSVGRPYKFLDPKKLAADIKSYFDDCDPHKENRLVENGVNQRGETTWIQRDIMTPQKPYSISSLAVYLGTSRKLLLDYQNPDHYPQDMDPAVRDELINTIDLAKARCEAYAEEYLLSGKPSKGAEFVLQNGYGWTNKLQTDNKNHNVNETLDELDAIDRVAEGSDEMGEAAQQEIAKMEAAKSGSPDSQDQPEGSPPAEQVVENDPPLQD